MSVKRRIAGLKNIHAARMINTTNLPTSNPAYTVPVPVKGAISCSVELSYSDITMYADDTVDFMDSIFESGSISLELSALTLEDYDTLFGLEVKNGTVTGTNAVAPNLAILFETSKLGSNAKRYFVVYNCVLKAPSLSSVTNKGAIEETTITIEGLVGELSNGKQYMILDTDHVDVDMAMVEGFFSEVQFADAKKDVVEDEPEMEEDTEIEEMA